MANLRQIGFSLTLYASDSDDHLPPRGRWIDASYPYVKTMEAFRCPDAQGAYGYAFNGPLDGTSLKAIRNPETVPLVYDSVNPIRNASDAFASLPVPGRHVLRGERGNYIAYADGHARFRSDEKPHP